MNAANAFEQDVANDIRRMSEDANLKQATLAWVKATSPHRYTYHFSSLGRPLIQFPQDMVAVQELIWKERPDLIIETGIAHGGSLIMSASQLAMLDYCDAVEQKKSLDPMITKRRVLGIDIDIRAHNREAIEAHPMGHRIDMIEGSSIEPAVVAQVRKIAAQHERVLVLLDSNHTHEHVLAELEAYAPLVSPGSYCVVFDTLIEDMPPGSYPDRPWDVGNNPKTAVTEFLRRDGRFEIDRDIEAKIQITVAPDGYLRRVR